MKKRILNMLAALLLAAGLGVMLYPWLSDLWARRRMSAELEQYQDVIEAGSAYGDALWAQAEIYNRELARKEDQFRMEPGEMERVSALLNPMGNAMMGNVSVPKINVNLPVYQGTEETQLQSGAGWIYGTSLPTGGKSTHCVVTAHSGLAKAKLFTDLEKLEVGDRFSMKVMGREMDYEVDRILVAEPEDFSALAIVPGEDLMTLYTCTPCGVNTHRLLVRGRRTGTAGMQLEIEVFDGPPRVRKPLACAALAVLPAAAAALAYGGRLRRKRCRRRGKTHRRPPATAAADAGRSRGYPPRRNPVGQARTTAPPSVRDSRFP